MIEMRRSIPKVLTEQEAKSFFDQCNLNYRRPHRDYLMCRLMYKTGLRVSEVCNLKEDHINWDTGRIIVRDGKGGRDRSVFLKGDLKDEIRAWYDEYSNCDFIFSTTTGNQVDTSQLRRTVNRVAPKANIKESERVSNHTFRHSFSVKFYSETHNLRALQRILGHSNVSTTEIYTRILDDEVEELMTQVA